MLAKSLVYGRKNIGQAGAVRLGPVARARALALVAAWPLLATAAQLNEFRDAHVLAHYEIAARDSVLRWHQMPLWDPYYCGVPSRYMPPQ